MSQHKSLKIKRFKTIRSVYKRWERIQKLARNEKWVDENASVYNLPKDKIVRIKKRIKEEKVKVEEGVITPNVA